MALPVTLSGLALNRRIVGPFKSSAGNFYLFGVDGTTATTLQAYKSTSPDVSWASIATKTAFTTAILGLAGYQVADVIHLVINDGSGTSWNYKYQTFNMATDAFVTAETITSAINPKDSAAGVYGLCEIVFRPSDSQPVVLYPGPQVSGHAKVNYKVRTGVATWSAAVVVDAAVTTVDYYPVGIALGASSTVHFLIDAIAGGAVQRALTSANALQTAVNVTAFAANGSGKGNSLVSGTTKVCFVDNHTTPNNAIAAYFDSASVPTISSSADIGSSAAANAGARVYVNGTDFWTIYTRSDTGDVYAAKSSDFGATWSAETLLMTATATTSGPNGDEFLSFNGNGTVYTRGGVVVLGFVVNDGGTLKYNEFALPLSATLSATLGAATLAATGNVIVRGYLRGPGTAARVSEAASNRVTEAGSTRRLEGYGLADLALAATGKVIVQGTAAATLATLTLLATGTVGSQVSTGTLAATLDTLTLAGTGQVLARGTLGVTLGDLTGTLSGKVTVSGTAAGTLLPLTVVGTGTVANQIFTGTLAQTLAPLALAGTGQVAIKGTLGVTLDAVQLIASSSPVAVGSLSATFGPATLAAAGSLGAPPLSATLSITLGALSGTLTGKVTVSGTAAGTLLPMVLVGTGTVTVAPRVGTLNALLDDLGLRGHGHTFLPWTTEARRHQLWARETPPTAIGITDRITENRNRRITEAYDARIIDGLDWALEPRAYGGWSVDRLAFTGPNNRRRTQQDSRRITEASDVRVLEDSSIWINEAPRPVNLWTKE